jgi:O-methyltransferase
VGERVLSVMPAWTAATRDYQREPFTRPGVMAELQAALATLGKHFGLNAPGGHGVASDSLITWFKRIGFTSDPDFVRAMQAHAGSNVLKGRLWRLYTLCWAARSCLALAGDFLDLGVYNGKAIDVVRRYCGDIGARRWHLYDAFDHHPAEPSKGSHGPELCGKVRAMFADDPRFEIVPGLLPATLDLSGPVAFVQVDLNHAEAEIACLERVWPHLVPGAMVVLDDYGFERYRASYEAERAFFAERGHGVLELPTGQGLVVRR